MVRTFLFAAILTTAAGCSSKPRPPAQPADTGEVADPPDNAMCGPLRQLIAAAADGKFASVRGAPSDPDYPDTSAAYASTVTLPGASACEVDREDESNPATVWCQMRRTSDHAEATKLQQELAATVLGCLPAEGWETDSTPDIASYFTGDEASGEISVEVRVRGAGVPVTDYDVTIEINGATGS